MKKIFVFIFLAFTGVAFAIIFSNSSNGKGPAEISTVKTGRTPTPLNKNQIGIPGVISIPSLGVTAKIESVKRDKLGRMDIPKSYNNAGWYSLGPKPGEAGSAVIDGHVDTPQGNPSIFANIDELQPGDEIIIQDSSGKNRIFTVARGVNYPLSNIPLEYIFDTNTSEKRLNLITCSGRWDKSKKMYTERYVVYAVLK